jgi:hypothetical protein
MISTTRFATTLARSCSSARNQVHRLTVCSTPSAFTGGATESLP